MNYGSVQEVIISWKINTQIQGYEKGQGRALSLGYAFIASTNLVPRYHE